MKVYLVTTSNIRVGAIGSITRGALQMVGTSLVFMALLLLPIVSLFGWVVSEMD